jgi:hypothetical protein
MTQGIFHITLATLVGAMTVAGVAIAMAPSKAEPPKVAKTAPAVAPVATSAAAQSTNCKVSLAQYQNLAMGMSYSRAVAALGCEGSELSRTDMAGHRTVMFMWQGKSLGANMNAMFQNDALVSRAQFGLR